MSLRLPILSLQGRICASGAPCVGYAGFRASPRPFPIKILRSALRPWSVETVCAGAFLRMTAIFPDDYPFPQRDEAPAARCGWGLVVGGGSATCRRASASGVAQKAATFRRPPVRVLPFSETVGSALLRMALLMAAADEPGWYAAYSAAAPLTCGVAMDVPL